MKYAKGDYTMKYTKTSVATLVCVLLGACGSDFSSSNRLTEPPSSRGSVVFAVNSCLQLSRRYGRRDTDRLTVERQVTQANDGVVLPEFYYNRPSDIVLTGFSEVDAIRERQWAINDRIINDC